MVNNPTSKSRWWGGDGTSRRPSIHGWKLPTAYASCNVLFSLYIERQSVSVDKAVGSSGTTRGGRFANAMEHVLIIAQGDHGCPRAPTLGFDHCVFGRFPKNVVALSGSQTTPKVGLGSLHQLTKGVHSSFQ